MRAMESTASARGECLRDDPISARFEEEFH